MTTKNLKLPARRAPRTPEDLHAEGLLLRWGLAHRKLTRETIDELAEILARARAYTRAHLPAIAPLPAGRS